MVQLDPPLGELATKTSVSVLTVEKEQGDAQAVTPLRLSEKEMYSTVEPWPGPEGGSTGRLPAELTRNWLLVSVWRPSTLTGGALDPSKIGQTAWEGPGELGTAFDAQTAEYW